MKNILSLLFIVSICACSKSDKETYTVSGRFVDGTNPKNKFANLKLHFEDTYHYREIVKLGETFTDSNGYFKFTYEYGTPFRTNFMKILVDSNFLAKNKLQGLEVSSNWNKIFYLGDSALINLKIDTFIKLNDTLFFSNGDSLYTFLGPISKGTFYQIKVINYSSNGLAGYSLGAMVYPKNMILINYLPTGEPIIDQLTLF
jgi:hypothetical protein